MKVDELLRLYAAGKRDFNWVDLKGADLAGAKLAEISLSRADLTGAILAKADLSGANLIKANLSGAGLQGANLSGAKLNKAEVTEAELDGTNLTKADVSGVNLAAANMRGAIMPDGIPYDEWLIAQYSAPTLLMETEATGEIQLPKLQVEVNTPTVTQESLQTRNRGRFTAQEFRDKLPWPSLLLLWLGYIFFGLLLAFQQAPWFAWFFAWAGSIAWVADESLTLFGPVTGAVAIIFSMPGIGLLLKVICGVTTLMAVAGMWVSGGKARAGLRDGLWVGGICGTGFLILGWLFLGGAETLPLALLLVLAIVGAGFGSMTSIQMDITGFSKKQILQVFGSVTALGLCLGLVVENLFWH